MRRVVFLASFALLLPVSYTRADDFADHLAQLKAMNAGRSTPKAACPCGPSCPCASGECDSPACPTAPKDGATKVGADGRTYTFTRGYGWWRYADPVPVIDIVPSAASDVPSSAYLDYLSVYNRARAAELRKMANEFVPITPVPPRFGGRRGGGGCGPGG